jgi:molybdate transport system permease protein
VLVLLARAVATGSVLAALTDPAVVDALALSTLTTSICVVLVLVLGIPLALLLARSHFRGSALLETIVDLPIVLPPSVAGIALLLVLGRRGLLGDPLAALGLTLPFTTAAVVLAQFFVAAPFFIRSARAGLAGVEREIEDAARVDGATERQVFRYVTAPLAAPALAAGLVTAWARALGEFGATIIFAGSIEGRTQTLPLVVYGEFQSSNLDASIAASAVLVIAALIALLLVRGLHWSRALDARGAG